MTVLFDFRMSVLEPLEVSRQVGDVPVPSPSGIGFDEIKVVSQVAEVLGFTCVCTFSAKEVRVISRTHLRVAFMTGADNVCLWCVVVSFAEC